MEDNKRLFNEADTKYGKGDGRLTKEAYLKYREAETDMQNERYGVSTGFLGDEVMQDMEYNMINTITPD